MYKLYMHVALAVMNEEQQYDISVLMLQGYFCLARHLLLYRVDRCYECGGIQFQTAAEYYNLLDVPRERVLNFPQRQEQAAC
ncbi:MAG: hypothetical protein AAB517_01420 [Patescibacteria group bacterium]